MSSSFRSLMKGDQNGKAGDYHDSRGDKQKSLLDRTNDTLLEAKNLVNRNRGDTIGFFTDFIPHPKTQPGRFESD